MLVVLLLTLTGCVRRTVTITSDPPGTLVWLNDREIGRTPVDVDFVFYGHYDVRLEREGYEPRMTSAVVRPPWWDNIPLDFFAEIAPFDLHSSTMWHFNMEPLNDDPDALLERAREMRSRAE